MYLPWPFFDMLIYFKMAAFINPIGTGRYFTHFVLGGGRFSPPLFFSETTRDITIRLTPIVP